MVETLKNNYTKRKGLLCAFVVLLLVSFNTSCKKYEDGPRLSLRTKKMRITGDWQMYAVVSNGASSRPKDANHLLIDKDGRFMIETYPPGIGSWEFSKDAKSLILHYEPNGAELIMNITRLTEYDLWIEQEITGGDRQLVKLRKIKS